MGTGNKKTERSPSVGKSVSGVKQMEKYEEKKITKGGR